MADVDLRIGYIGTESGELTYPEQTLSGQGYSHIGGLHVLSDGKRFVILDQDTPRDFDVRAELAKLDPPKAMPQTFTSNPAAPMTKKANTDGA